MEIYHADGRQTESNPHGRGTSTLMGPETLPRTATRLGQALTPGVRLAAFVLFFSVLWQFGMGMADFAIGVWIFQRTGNATELGLYHMAAALPAVLFSTWAGYCADRWDRRWLMIIARLGIGVATAGMAGLALVGILDVWHLAAANFVIASCGALGATAWSATVPLLVSKEQLGRFYGLYTLGFMLPAMMAPMFAPVVLETIGLEGILALSFVGVGVATVSLMAVRFPQVAKAEASGQRPSLLHNLDEARRYLAARIELGWLAVWYGLWCYSSAGAVFLATPLVLGLHSAAELGKVFAAAGAGFLIGTAIIGVWGGGRRRVIAACVAASLQAGLLCGIALSTEIPFLVVGVGTFAVLHPIVDGLVVPIFQRKVAPEMQGRVAGFVATVLASARGLAFVTLGPLVDRVLEPLLAEGSPFAQEIGFGPRRGAAVAGLLIAGLLLVAVLVGLSVRPLRQVEMRVPDALG